MSSMVNNNSLFLHDAGKVLWIKGTKCGALRDSVPFAQFKKRKKHLWRRVNFSKVAGY